MSNSSIWSATGAPLSARMAREQLFLSSGGQTGVIHPDSLKVIAQGTPNNTVIISPGSFAITATSRTAAIGYTSAPWQSYGRSLYEPVTVEIEPTSTSGPRTDVVGIVIDDPEFEGVDMTADELLAHEFWRPHVVRNAGNAATRPEHFASLRRPFLPLAQIRMPASTGTVTENHIHDIRFMAISQSETVDLVAPANPGSGNLDITPSDTSWVNLVSFEDIQIPQWATRVKVAMMITHLNPIGGRVGGLFRTAVEGANEQLASPSSSFIDTTEGQGWIRFQVHSAGDIPLHRSSQGGTLKVTPQIRRTEDRPGTVRIPDYATHTSMASGRVTFEEAPIHSTDGA